MTFDLPNRDLGLCSSLFIQHFTYGQIKHMHGIHSHLYTDDTPLCMSVKAADHHKSETCMTSVKAKCLNRGLTVILNICDHSKLDN